MLKASNTARRGGGVQAYSNYHPSLIISLYAAMGETRTKVNSKFLFYGGSLHNEQGRFPAKSMINHVVKSYHTWYSISRGLEWHFRPEHRRRMSYGKATRLLTHVLIVLSIYRISYVHITWYYVILYYTIFIVSVKKRANRYAPAVVYYNSNS